LDLVKSSTAKKKTATREATSVTTSTRATVSVTPRSLAELKLGEGRGVEAVGAVAPTGAAAGAAEGAGGGGGGGMAATGFANLSLGA